MNRIKEILKRKAEINEILNDEKRSKDTDLKALEKEVRELNEELEELQTRQRLLDETKQIEDGQVQTRKVETFGNSKEEKREKGPDSEEYRKAFMNYVLRGDKIPTELRDDEITFTADVGSVIPNTILNRIIEKLEATGMILPLVTRTSIKGGVTVPTSSVKPVATWVAEGAGSDKQKKTTGSITFAYHKLRCAVAVSLEVDTVTLEIFESVLVNNIVEAMVKALEQAIVSGDGTGKPKGILAETPADGQAIDVAKIEYQTLIDAESALPLEYENGAVWTMTKKTFMSFIGMVDNNGQPIARVNYGINGRPERTLLGRTVVLCNYVDSFVTADTGSPFAFLFNYTDYILNTNYRMGIKKYEDNDTEDQVTKSVMLVDGKVVDVNSLVVLNKADAA
ncbi:phage major capsid protein [Halalkalibacter sp. APA_J-10(15)]|uniref:phage major capsid protein n=1 Tax=Halalkalibacter sp. APA_J-10(15) TaxID=2933805 RepID=UPI001FF5A3AF|nr:phage major capsid protein [Halalkalibacter sp. APA_J-10(15)]MCK0471399.1 phage major capsid protein [Halalkalibacter sp. APA_J-10(15)]